MQEDTTQSIDKILSKLNPVLSSFFHPNSVVTSIHDLFSADAYLLCGLASRLPIDDRSFLLQISEHDVRGVNIPKPQRG